MSQIQLLIIDPQNDFCEPNGALSVPGALADMARLARLLDRLGPRITDIHITLDAHHFVDIAHPVFWLDAAGNHPAPFTIISHQDVLDGKFRPTQAQYRNWALSYTASLAANNRFALCLWPPHCLIGSWGNQVQAGLYSSLRAWENARERSVNYVSKGSNFLTEHYSAIQADVKREDDPDTGLNRALLNSLAGADRVIIAGEAMSHCVRFSTLDLLDNLPLGAAGKLTILSDAMSSVGGFEPVGQEFLEIARARGVQVETCAALKL